MKKQDTGQRDGSFHSCAVTSTIHYSMIQGFFWMSFCVILAYASVYLLSKGFKNSEIGYVIAIAGILSAILQPLAGELADSGRKITLHVMISAISLLIILSAALLYVSKNHFLFTALFYGIMVASLQMNTPLVNALGMHFINQGIPVNFGIARGMGSLLYAAASFIMGILVQKYDTGVIPLACILVYIILIISTVTFRFKGKKNGTLSEPHLEQQKSITDRKESFAATHKDFMVLIAGATLLFTSHNMLNNYVFQIVSYYGEGSAAMGRVTALAAMTELPTMFLFAFVIKKISAGRLLKISGIFFTLKSLFTYIAIGMTMLYVAQLMQMLGFALFAVASVYYVNVEIEEKSRVKGQAYMTITNTAGSVAGSLLGGWLLDFASMPVMLLVSTITAAVGAIVVFKSAHSNEIK